MKQVPKNFVKQYGSLKNRDILQCNLKCYDRPENSQEYKRRRNRDVSCMSQPWENSQSELDLFRYQSYLISGCKCTGY